MLLLLALAFTKSFLFQSSYFPFGFRGGFGMRLLFFVNPGKIADLLTKGGCSFDFEDYYSSKTINALY